jgi:hypothetical protein
MHFPALREYAHMEQHTKRNALVVWVLASVVAGVALIVYGSTLLAIVGAVLIILGLVALMPALRYAWWEPEAE